MLRVHPRKPPTLDRSCRLAVPRGTNMVWSMDFLVDRRRDSRALWRLNALDFFNRNGLENKVHVLLPADWIMRSPERMIEFGGNPNTTGVENGSQGIGGKLMMWAESGASQVSAANPGSRSGTPTSSAVTAQSGMNGLTIPSRKPSRRPKSTPRHGPDPAPRITRTWRWAAEYPPGN